MLATVGLEPAETDTAVDRSDAPPSDTSIGGGATTAVLSEKSARRRPRYRIETTGAGEMATAVLILPNQSRCLALVLTKGVSVWQAALLTGWEVTVTVRRQETESSATVDRWGTTESSATAARWSTTESSATAARRY
eukprot:COSAG03_NODE_2028_length_3205_cov_8.768191_2_plen_137_part_00